MPHPTIRELYQVIRFVKQQIDNECRAHEEDEIPGILLTVGISEDGSWDYQTGSNEYSGPAYFHPVWVVISVYRNSNCLDLARSVKDEYSYNKADEEWLATVKNNYNAA
jgi:hypothetical protein